MLILPSTCQEEHMDAAEPWSAKGPRAAAAVLTARVGADKAGLQRAPRKDGDEEQGKLRQCSR